MTRPVSQFAGQYREWDPAVALRDHLSRVWVNDLTRSSAKDYLVVPDGCVDILWVGEKLCVAGPDTRPILEQVRSGCRIAGVRFRPGAAYPWLGVPLSEIVNARIPLAEFWGREAGRLADRVSAATGSIAATTVLQQALLGRIARVGQADRQIAFLRRSAASVHKESPAGGVRELSRRMGISERTLRRRCIDAFGYGFKTLQRVLRFQRLFCLAALSTHPNLADLALEAGFADQAHMSREVQRLCDTTPAEFVAQLSR
jgi:AraC-like DNA-binding protein